MTTPHPKERAIRIACLQHDKRLVDLARDAHCSVSFFYRVVRAEATSQAVDDFIAAQLNLNPETLKELSNAKQTA